MTVLSDTTIKTLMAQNLLVLRGDQNRAIGAGYQFRPELVLPGGSEKAIRLIGPATTIPSPIPQDVSFQESYVVGPRSLVWVRMLETVKLPNDTCAFWWQTNSLSRQGLMLVNMSMVAPGYEGPLACLFVNFGTREVRISAEMTMARLVFQKLDKAANPYRYSKRLSEYDDGLANDALAASSSFLSLDDYRVEFQQARDYAEAEFDDAVKDKTRELVRDLRKETEAAIEKVKDPFNAWKSVGVAAFGLVLLLAALKFVPWIESLWPQRLEGTVEKSVDSALQDSDLVQRIIKLETQLDGLSAQGNSQSSSGGGTN